MRNFFADVSQYTWDIDLHTHRPLILWFQVSVYLYAIWFQKFRISVSINELCSLYEQINVSVRLKQWQQSTCSLAAVKGDATPRAAGGGGTSVKNRDRWSKATLSRRSYVTILSPNGVHRSMPTTTPTYSFGWQASL